MVNSGEFIKRLEQILTYYDLSASSFADRIKAQRSSISHLLSGRNKPSLEFVMKVITAFPEVNLYWLLNGKGSFPSNTNKQESEPLPAPNSVIIKNEPVKQTAIADKKIEKVIVFYTDGSFKSYHE